MVRGLSRLHFEHRIYDHTPVSEALTDRPELSVVIPCYNEQANLEHGALEEVRTYVDQLDHTWEVIVVDDESTDASLAFCQKFCAEHPGFRSIEIPHGGKPAAVFAGIQDARGDIVLFTDMDQSTPLREWDRLRPFFSHGYDVVIGGRGGGREGFSPLRKMGSRVFRGIRKSMLLPELEDTQCGFKACRRQLALTWFPRLQFFERVNEPTGWKVSAFDVELLYLFKRAGASIREVEVEWVNRDRSETKGDVPEMLRYVHESREMFAEVLRVRLNEARGLYD